MLQLNWINEILFYETKGNDKQMKMNQIWNNFKWIKEEKNEKKKNEKKIERKTCEICSIFILQSLPFTLYTQVHILISVSVRQMEQIDVVVFTSSLSTLSS